MEDCGRVQGRRRVLILGILGHAESHGHHDDGHHCTLNLPT
jgi:hypothetical protein